MVGGGERDETHHLLGRVFDEPGRRRVLADGEVLARQGDPAEHVYLVVDGRLDVTVLVPQTDADAPRPDLRLATLGPGAIAGEVTVVAGGRRTATLAADGPTTVVEIGRGDFEEWLLDHPDQMYDLITRSRERLDRTLVAQILAELVGEDETDEAIASVVERIELTRLRGGEQLFAQGDTSDAAYVVVSGRLRVDVTSPERRVLGEVGRGEVVGEIGLLDDAPRSASVKAIRDTTLARLSLEEFRALIRERPQMILHFARTVLRRTAGRPTRDDRARALTVVVTAAEPGALMEDLTSALQGAGSTMRLTAEGVDEVLDRRGVAHRATGATGVPRLAEYLHEMEGRHDHLVYETVVAAGDDPDEWTRLAMRQSDRVAIVVGARPSAEELDRLRALAELAATNPDVPAWVVVVEDGGATHPTSVASVRGLFPSGEVVHVRRGSAADASRLSRLLTDRGVGLVLSGGGAKGFAHIGALESLIEAGVPIDRVGGTSIGAILAGATAIGVEPGACTEMCSSLFRRLMDYTVPLVSLVRGRRIEAGLEEVFSGWDAADTWIPYFCVSADLTAGRLRVHDSGELARALRASISIPGMLPPVVHDGHLLVDGGVLDNLPVETMRTRRGIGQVVAVDVAPVDGPSAPAELAGVTTSDFLRARLSRSSDEVPGLGAVLIRSMLVGAARHRHRMIEAGTVDLCVEIDVSGVGLLEFERVEEVAARGRSVTARVLAESSVDWPA